MPFALFNCLRASQESRDSPSLGLEAVGDGQDEDALTNLGGTHVGSRQDRPRHDIPEVFQVPLDFRKGASLFAPKLAAEEPEDVLDEDPVGFEVEDMLPDVGPEPSVVRGSCTQTGLRVGLARDPSNVTMCDSTPRASVKGPEVTPDRSGSQGSLFHARNHIRGCKCFPFDVQCWATMSACDSVSELNAKVEASDARACADPVAGPGTYSHIASLRWSGAGWPPHSPLRQTDCACPPPRCAPGESRRTPRSCHGMRPWPCRAAAPAARCGPRTRPSSA